MKKARDCENMVDIREAIDQIDNQIVKLISSRAKYVHEAARFKKSEAAVRDPERVEKVITSRKAWAIEYGASPALIGNLFAMMIDFFIAEEMKVWESQ